MMMRKSNVSPIDINILHDMGNSSIFLNTLKAPKNIKYKLDGKFLGLHKGAGK